jgi:PGF-pre-PGF domain-containing protein/PGF-CTERM protein
MTVQFSQGAVNSVTFSEGQEGGSIDVEEYDSTPPGAPDTGDRPVMESVVITPSEEHRDTAATIEITVDQTEVLRADATAEDLAVLKATDTGYQTLDTDVVEDNGDVTLAAETPGFSAFIVSTDEGDIESSDGSSSSTDSNSDSGSGSDADGTTTGTATPGDDVIEPSDPNTNTEAVEPDEQPGFMIGTAIIALSVVTLLARRRVES